MAFLGLCPSEGRHNFPLQFEFITKGNANYFMLIMVMIVVVVVVFVRLLLVNNHFETLPHRHLDK